MAALRRRRASVVVLGIAISVVLALNIAQLHAERDATGRLLRTTPWAAWQVEKEYLRFVHAWHHFREERTQASLDDLRFRFQILYSRPHAILNGPETEILREMPGVVELIQKLMARLDELEPAIFALGVGSEHNEIIERFHRDFMPLAASFMDSLGKISLNSNVGPMPRRLRESVRELQRRSTWLQILLVALSLALILILSLEVRRNRRLAEAETRLRKIADDANSALRDREQRYRQLVESTDAVPYTLDLSSMAFSYVGPQAGRLLGFPVADWLKEAFWIRQLHPGDRERFAEERRQGVQQNDELSLEYRMIDAAGQTVWVRDVLKVVRESEGRIVGYGLLFDDTTVKLRDQELVAAQKMEAMGQLTGGVAHDFNNLLTIIIGNLELMKRKIAAESPIHRQLSRAQDAAERGARLTRQLLGFARRQTLEPQDFDANELVNATIELMRRTLGEHIAITASLDPHLWPVHADPAQVESALTNLAINARDAMPGGGRITVATSNWSSEQNPDVSSTVPPGDYVLFSVTDSGAGMSPEVLSRVFEPFFTTKPDGKGTGLGLSMVFGFVRQSRGHIEIISEPGRGSTVLFYLPRGRAGAASAVKADEAHETPPADGSRVLVVEDNAEVREIAVERLRDLGIEVIEADSGPAGLEIVEQDAEIDLLFTDIVMPGGMSGIELAEAARRLRSDLKILFTSGYYDDSDEADRRIAEMGQMLRKPYTMDELEQKLRDVLPVRPRGDRASGEMCLDDLMG